MRKPEHDHYVNELKSFIKKHKCHSVGCNNCGEDLFMSSEHSADDVNIVEKYLVNHGCPYCPRHLNLNLYSWTKRARGLELFTFKLSETQISILRIPRNYKSPDYLTDKEVEGESYWWANCTRVSEKNHKVEAPIPIKHSVIVERKAHPVSYGEIQHQKGLTFKYIHKFEFEGMKYFVCILSSLFPEENEDYIKLYPITALIESSEKKDLKYTPETEIIFHERSEELVFDSLYKELNKIRGYKKNVYGIVHKLLINLKAVSAQGKSPNICPISGAVLIGNQKYVDAEARNLANSILLGRKFGMDDGGFSEDDSGEGEGSAA